MTSGLDQQRDADSRWRVQQGKWYFETNHGGKVNKYEHIFQNPGDMIKRPNLRTHQVQEVLGYKPEARTVREITAENYSSLGKDMDIETQETESQIDANERELYIQLYTKKNMT